MTPKWSPPDPRHRVPATGCISPSPYVAREYETWSGGEEIETTQMRVQKDPRMVSQMHSPIDPK